MLALHEFKLVWHCVKGAWSQFRLAAWKRLAILILVATTIPTPVHASQTNLLSSGSANGSEPVKEASLPAVAGPPATSGNGWGSAFKTDIEYGQAGDEHLCLDASVPNGPGPFPVAILVHGGGWSGGNKQRDITPLFALLTKANFTWFSIDYRLAPKHRWPACLEDLQTAIRWVKKHAPEYKGDPNRIAILGYSAGGQLVSQAAVLAKEDTRVQAVVGFAPPNDLVADTERRGGLSKSLQALLNREVVDETTRALLKEMSPINHIHPDLPPFLLVQGDADKTVPFEQATNFQSKLKTRGVPCELITVKGAPHRLDDWAAFDPTYKGKVIDWLDKRLAR